MLYKFGFTTICFYRHSWSFPCLSFDIKIFKKNRQCQNGSSWQSSLVLWILEASNTPIYKYTHNMLKKEYLSLEAEKSGRTCQDFFLKPQNCNLIGLSFTWFHLLKTVLNHNSHFFPLQLSYFLICNLFLYFHFNRSVNSIMVFDGEK